MIEKKIFDFARETSTVLIVNGSENAVDKNFFYLSGIDNGVFEGSALIATPDTIKIITGQLEEEAARSSGHEVMIYRNKDEFENLLKENLKGVDSVGLNYSSVTLTIYTGLLRMIPEKSFVDVSASIAEARRFKTPEEIHRITEAGRIACEAIDHVYDGVKEGMTENEVASMLVSEMMKAGASGPSFTTIVAFGENASMPHYTPGKRKLHKGDFILTDFGALYKRYCSDVTRTAVFGKASEKQRLMYETVLRAQTESMKAIKENMNGKDIDKIARDIIDSTEFKGKFIHSLGHGLGMDVHDHPALSSGADFTLKAGMVVTVEPGIYLPKFGGVRIEDDVLVTKDGFTLLTKAQRDLLEL
jgi:Xaa-Pro dipeptidase